MRLTLALVLALLAGDARALTPEAYADLTGSLIFGTVESARDSLAEIRERGEPDAAASLILALRFGRPVDKRSVSGVLEQVTGAAADGWFDWMLWQQGSDVRSHPGHHLLQRRVWRSIDPAFDHFFANDVPSKIRLEEIVWGGVRVDGIPALTNPRMIDAADATYLRPEDEVFGVALGGEARAYPLRITNWHEMVNDVVGGVPVSLAYCTLCNAGILFRTDVAGFDEPLVFGSSGLLYRSNKLMYDDATRSLWNHFSGRPVVGPLAASDIELEVLPLVTTTWAEWRRLHPDTQVLARDTGYDRDYSAGAAYGSYFASPDLMFPALADAPGLRAKDEIFGVRAPGGAVAWPLEAFDGGAVHHGSAGLWDLVVVGDAAQRTARAYRIEPGERFEMAADDVLVRGDGTRFQIEEAALVASNGEQRPRVPGHLAYWFAWAGNLGPDSLQTAER